MQFVKLINGVNDNIQYRWEYVSLPYSDVNGLSLTVTTIVTGAFKVWVFFQ